MSKSAVPDIYTKVIRDVIEASRHDFEEGGVDLSALELLKKGWHTRLTKEHIATFPWEPKPEPVKAEAKSVPSTLPSNGNVHTPPSHNSTPGPQPKQEHYAQREPQQQQYPTQQRFPQQPSAQARAAEYLREQYGARAQDQIDILQGSAPAPGVNGAQVPGKQDFKQEFKAEFTPEMKQENNYQQQWTNQVDGPSDWHEQYSQRKALVNQHREASDRLIRQQVEQSQKSMEGGGLLMPLSAHNPSTSSPSSRTMLGASRAQGDAAGDEDDEDAINSDLDDPDDLEDNPDNDDNVGNVMLCTYDKVQRVKNKWKCTLKDGVLKVDGSEFVFHKGQGEFEW